MMLTEVTFRELLSFTQSNGRYRIGALRKVGDKWVTDARIKDRIQNSMYVVTKPPTFGAGPRRYMQMRFNFKSKPDASTTGLRQKGYIEMVPPPGKTSFTVKRGWDADVRCYCSCPDFKFRWHKALADKGASHTPTGEGGEAINADPVVTNPTKALSLCKHLAAMALYLATAGKDIDAFDTYSAQEPTTPKKQALPTGVAVDTSTAPVRPTV